MINETVYKWLSDRGFGDRITEHKETIDTVEHAAQQIGYEKAGFKIIKSLPKHEMFEGEKVDCWLMELAL